MSSRKLTRLLGEYGYDVISILSDKGHKVKVADSYTDQTIEILLWRLEKLISSGYRLTEKEYMKTQTPFYKFRERFNLEKDSI